MALIRRLVAFSVVVVVTLIAPSPATAVPPAGPDPSRLVSGLQGSVGSTVGPDGALYVPEAITGKVTRIDPGTGATATLVSGLPKKILGNGGVMDVAFLDRTAYVLVTLVDPGVGGSSVDGIYRIDGPTRFTLIADIGGFAIANPPKTAFSVATGVQFAMEPYRGGFLVTDGHHNRVYRVTLDGTVSELIAFDNIVPTGLAVRGPTVYMAEAGPVPHLPETGKIVKFQPGGTTASPVAAGARLLVDVEFGPQRQLYGLSQGVFGTGAPGSPAQPNTGALMKATPDGGFTVVLESLNVPTSMEIIGNTAYIVTLGGEVWKIANVTDPQS